MPQKFLPWILALTVTLVLGVGWQVHSLGARIEFAVNRQAKEPEMTTVAWKSGGSTVTHAGSPRAGETFAEFAARFRSEVDVLKTQFPEDP